MGILLNEMPSYINTVLEFNVKESGFLSALPHIARILAAFGAGIMSDYFIRSRKVSVVHVRKLFTAIGKTRCKSNFINY